MKFRLTLLLLILFNIRTVSAQNYNFTLHYPLEVNFAASGLEKQQIAELSNGNLVLHRFEFDSVTMQHQLQYWSVDPLANTLWSKVLSIGQGDSVQLNSSCSVNGDHFILAYTKVLGYAHSTANAIVCNNTGDIIESVELTIPNAQLIPVLATTISNNEYIVGGTFHNASGQTSVFIGRSSSQSFQNTEMYTTAGLHSLSDLYNGENNTLHVLGTYSNRTSDLAFNWTNEASGKKFPENIILRKAIYSPLLGTFYAGSNYAAPSFPKAILLGNNWYKELQITSGIMQLSTASDLTFHQGDILLTGYCSNPVPKTFISRFDASGQGTETKLYNSSHPFNYNAGTILEHSNGHIYLTELGGVTYTPSNSFVTSFLCLNPNLYNGCDGVLQNYQYDSIPVLSEADTIFFQEEGTISIIAPTIASSFLSDTILCHTHLGIQEIGSLKVELYPNPLTEKVNLKIPASLSANNITIHCFDALGRQITFKSTTVNAHEISIEFDPTVKGVILFQMRSGTQTLVTMGVLE